MRYIYVSVKGNYSVVLSIIIYFRLWSYEWNFVLRNLERSDISNSVLVYEVWIVSII